MKRTASPLALALVLAAAAPAAATECHAQLTKIRAGQVLVYGDTDHPAVRWVQITDLNGRSLQYIAVDDESRHTFADLLDFPVEPGNQLRAIFWDVQQQVVCVDEVQMPVYRPILDGDGGTGGRYPAERGGDPTAVPGRDRN